MPKANDKKPCKKGKEGDEKFKKRTEQKKLSMRRAREKLKSDPIKHEEVKKRDRERYKKKKEAGLIPRIKDLSRREVKDFRKKWRERSKQHRLAKKAKEKLTKFIKDISPLPTPDHDVELQLLHHNNNVQIPSTSRIACGRKIIKKNREKWRREREKLTENLKKVTNQRNRYKSKCSRLRKKLKQHLMTTPEKNVESILKNQSVTPQVKRNLLFGEVITQQIKKNFLQQNSSKERMKMFSTVLKGPLINKFKYSHRLSFLTSKRLAFTKYSKKKQQNLKIIRAKDAVRKFLEEDDASRLTAGKKETVTRHKTKKQIRYLNNSLKNLYSKFIKNSTYKGMSYSTFCKLRPFWILSPKVAERYTCLCKIHTNMSLIVKRLKLEKIINENSLEEILKSMCCEGQLNEDCLERKCESCKNKTIVCNTFNGQEKMSYENWLTKKTKIIVKGQEKLCLKTVKENKFCSKYEAVLELNKNMPHFMQHYTNVMHQYKEINILKKKS
ncbi:unnamed protein product [Psylliodes chrysocephalus]|uniref:Uncharacterized protein n=1 Tax=Psylliodes chrysocephalus TaxID=3402493 RepID=A0A9P0GCI1_9CUCU|nr:unnamed protein product [Psylliodes chrysocephala]